MIRMMKSVRCVWLCSAVEVHFREFVVHCRTQSSIIGKPKAEEEQATTNVTQNRGPRNNAQDVAEKSESAEKSENPNLGKEASRNSNEEARISTVTEGKERVEEGSNKVDERSGKDMSDQQGSLNESVAWSEEMEKHPDNLKRIPISEPLPAEPTSRTSSGFKAGISKREIPEEIVSVSDTPYGLDAELYTYVDPTLSQVCPILFVISYNSIMNGIGNSHSCCFCNNNIVVLRFITWVVTS